MTHLRHGCSLFFVAPRRISIAGEAGADDRELRHQGLGGDDAQKALRDRFRSSK
jgi:hypothetical protein